MKLLVDMNLSPLWIDWLAAAGITAMHWSAVGRIDASDSEIMGYAAENGYIVVTHDLDFGAILVATQGRKPSVVQIRSDILSSLFIGDALVRALQQMANELAEGALLTLDPGRVRLTLLPLPVDTATPKPNQ